MILEQSMLLKTSNQFIVNVKKKSFTLKSIFSINPGFLCYGPAKKKIIVIIFNSFQWCFRIISFMAKYNIQ